MATERFDTATVITDALRLKTRGDFSGAHATIESALAVLGVGDPETKSELLAFDGDLYEEENRPANAKRNYEDALRLISNDPYRRYSIELSLGSICERSNEANDAARWYAAAIATALSSESVSAGSAVMRLVALRGDRPRPEERTLCEQGIDHSWHVLGLSGVPDRSNLSRSASKLIEAAGKFSS